MKCYYEELGVARDADDAEIKSAYRKLALRWHPDKNLDRLDEAKEQFQKIQQAYEVLSDPQERAFFDKHRDQILRGKNSNYEDNTLDVFPYFTSACYKGFGDDDKSFYAVYREVFNKIAAEDAEFMDDDDDLDDIPTFGNAQSSYEDVVGPFYAYWQSYCTKKNYAWLCPYDIQEIKDRRILRAIEKETKKLVQNAKKERNEEIRSLVAFVRKRDKRVQAYNRLLEERAALNREKAHKNRQAQILRRQRELAEVKTKSKADNDGYEEQLKQLEQQYGNDSDEYVTDSDENGEAAEIDEVDENYDEEFFCVACSKAFKNSKNFENHATSKKHRENEERLRQEMLEEEESFGKLNVNDDEESDAAAENELDAETVEHLSENDDEVLDVNDEAVEDVIVEECENLKNTITNGVAKSKKSKKSKKNLPKVVNAADDESEPEKSVLNLVTEASDDDDDWSSNVTKKGNRKQQKKKQTKKVENIVKPQEEQPVAATIPATKAVVELTEESNMEQCIAATHLCATCQSTFESKNKLFAHLKKTNHSVYLPKSNAPKTSQTAEGATKKGKGKRR